MHNVAWARRTTVVRVKIAYNTRRCERSEYLQNPTNLLALSVLRVVLYNVIQCVGAMVRNIDVCVEKFKVIICWGVTYMLCGDARTLGWSLFQ